MVNTRTDAELSATVQNALQTLLLQIRVEIREEFRTSSGPSDSGENPPPVTIHTWLERFNKQKPRLFEKATAPVDTENWISHMEKIFDIMGCDDAFKTRLTVYKFEGNALAWWKAYEQAKGGDVWLIIVTWAEFKKLFFLQFFPRAEQERLKREYHSIRQMDTETSMEFMQRFLRLAGVLRAAAGTAKEQAKNFQWGLRRSTRNHLMCISFTNVAQVANAARNYEILYERDDDDAERPDKRRGGGDNHRSSNNNYSGNNNRNSDNGHDQRNRGQQSNRSFNSGFQQSRGPSEGYSYPATAPVDAENWISHMEKIFDVMGCEDAFKTRLAMYKFEGDALAWWKAYKQAKGSDVWLITVTWAEFNELFFLQFFPLAEQERLKREYHSIRQTDTETSTEFMQHFLRLAGFLRAAAGTAEEQAKNFQWGLRKSTLNHLICIPFTDVAQVVNAARNYEILHERDDDDAERPDKR
nr:hypothetical protein [Tanacetum cinerariifolium]